MNAQILQILTVAIILLLTGCEKEPVQRMLVRDCTGTYIRIGKIDYKVCNADEFDHLQNHDLDFIAMLPAANCDNHFGCDLGHPFEAHVYLYEIQ